MDAGAVRFEAPVVRAVFSHCVIETALRLCAGRRASRRFRVGRGRRFAAETAGEVVFEAGGQRPRFGVRDGPNCRHGYPPALEIHHSDDHSQLVTGKSRKIDADNIRETPTEVRQIVISSDVTFL